MFNIEEFLTLEGYANEKRLARRKIHKGVPVPGGTQEYFTPYALVKKMADKISDDIWKDPQKTFLEPCAGNGQFVCYIIWKRLESGIDWKTALKTTYALELMADNVIEIKERILKMFQEMGVEFNKSVASRIMNKNIVCSDFFKWDFKNWRPFPEEKALF